MSVTLPITLADTLRVTVSSINPEALIFRGLSIVAIHRIARHAFTVGGICAARCLG
ncbi:hypothetical protein [Ralstonia insidiosa]|jgi:hypothetical protein|uniref:hypothetical protein n=1 Tax=Ralstonia sp. GP101 TaxID=3035146 RepID=UPI0003A483B1